MIIISPSKRQADPVFKSGLDKPRLYYKSQELITRLSNLSKAELAKILGVSEKRAALAWEEYQALSEGHDMSMEAINLYQGDVFKNLDVDSLSSEELDYLQDNLRIISPLYGLIKPLDGIWPYRLEMVTKVPGVSGLQDYWKGMQDLVDQENPAYIFNLASNEYSACIKASGDTKWIDVVFEDKKDSGYRIIAVKAKRMRGEILRYMAKNNIHKPEELRGFAHEVYKFSEAVSAPQRIVFRAG